MTQLYTDISELVQPEAHEGTSLAPLRVVGDAALLVENGEILAAGSSSEVTAHPAAAAAERVSLGKRAVVPGLVDSHTHLLFGGSRVDEMARRARGETYEQIAEAGGGIAASVAGIRNLSQDQLVADALGRVQAMLRRGTTTCEVKSGYGLEPALEMKQLRAIAELRQRAPISILPTLLAHIVPKAARDDRPAFVARFCNELMANVVAEQLAQFCDLFVESGAFEPSEARQIAGEAAARGLRLKLHVDQLRDGQGAALAAELGALSADHLEFTSDDGMRRLAEAGVVATILPGCPLYLGKGPWPDGRKLRDAGCDVAVATDCNPGSSMITDLPLCATIAATRCGLTLEEALWSVTRGGALALGLDDRGRLVAGERADFLVVDDTDWRALLYAPGDAPVASVVVAGEKVWARSDRPLK